MNTNTNSVTNPVPTSIIADSFACAMAVMENHEQRIGKVEQTVVRELDLISKDDIANRVAKQVDAEDIAEHVSITDLADSIDCDEVAQAMDIDLSDLADNYIDMSDLASNISMSDLAEYIDTDGIAEGVTEHIDLYSLAREFDTSDIANELDVADVAGYVDVDDVAANISIPDVAEQIVDNMKEGLSGSMVDAFVAAVNERDVLRELVLTLKADLRTEQQEQVKEIATFKARIEELEGEAENNRPVVDGAGPNDAAPTPELSNG